MVDSDGKGQIRGMKVDCRRYNRHVGANTMISRLWILRCTEMGRGPVALVDRCRKSVLSMVVRLVRTPKRLYPLADVVRNCSGDWRVRPAAEARQTGQVRVAGRTRGQGEAGKISRRSQLGAANSRRRRVAGARDTE